MRYPHENPPARPVPLPRQPILPSGVLGMLIFVITEAMVFAGFISAFMIVKSAATIWPPPDQPRLPVGETAFNTAALLLSGALLFWTGRVFLRKGPAAARMPMLASLLLGAFFVAFQGIEWAALIHQGLTLTTSAHGGFFYVIVGTHALHAVGALLGMAWVYAQLLRQRMTRAQLATIQVLWYFVVGIWPILYWRVYL